MNRGGFTPPKTVQVMSANGAAMLGVDDEMGTVEAGELADLVILEGDLESDLEVIENVVVVFNDGVGYDPGVLNRVGDGSGSISARVKAAPRGRYRPAPPPDRRPGMEERWKEVCRWRGVPARP